MLQFIKTTDTMKNLKPIQIAEKLKSFTDIDVFENTRRQEVVELRMLLCYLLREKLNMRWTHIAYFFNENGKTMAHASAINAHKQYDVHKQYNKKLEEYEKLFTFKSDLNYDEIDKIYYLENQIKNYQKKSETPLAELIKQIPLNKHDEAYEHLRRFVQSWEWKAAQD